MKNDLIARRYAKALFAVAQEDGKVEAIYEEISVFAEIIENKDNKDLKSFLSNPVCQQADKKAVVVELLKKVNITGITANFLRLLVDKRRITGLSGIVSAYQEFMDVMLNKVRIEVLSAYVMSDEQSARLKKQLEEFTGKNVELSVKDKDASLLGGIIVKIGDTVYDGSVKAQLNSVRALLREEM